MGQCKPEAHGISNSGSSSIMGNSFHLRRRERSERKRNPGLAQPKAIPSGAQHAGFRLSRFNHLLEEALRELVQTGKNGREGEQLRVRIGSASAGLIELRTYYGF